jgi:hypothetical protein
MSTKKVYSSELPVVTFLKFKYNYPYNITSKTITEDDKTTTQYCYNIFSSDVNLSETEFKNKLIEIINTLTNQYIVQYYDEGTQLTIHAYYNAAVASGNQDVIDACDAVFNWIDDVLTYASDIKNQINNKLKYSTIGLVDFDYETNVPLDSALPTRKQIKELFV